MHDQVHLYSYFKVLSKVNKISISELNCLHFFFELECGYRGLELLLCGRALPQHARSPGLITQHYPKPSPTITLGEVSDPAETV